VKLMVTGCISCLVLDVIKLWLFPDEPDHRGFALVE